MAEIVLGGYPAKRCVRLTHNLFDPAAPARGPVDAAKQQLIDAGVAFEQSVVEWLRCHFAGTEVLEIVDGDWSAAVRQTVAAMDDGVPVIAGPRLPDINGRSRAPDLLIGHGGGYLPVDVKNHKTLTSTVPSANPKSTSTVLASPLRAPTARAEVPGFSDKINQRRDDALQLAHYTRMLQDLGRHPAGADEPGLLLGGIIGPTDLTAVVGERLGIIWHRLAGSILAAYDDEFALRLRVAEAARAGRELVRPLRTTECATCDWFLHCAAVAGPHDASFALQIGHLNRAEWGYVYDTAGDGATLRMEQLAGFDVDEHLAAITAAVKASGGSTSRKRLAEAVRRAAMTVAGVDLEPVGATWPAVPAADIEIDLDIEWDGELRTYQWGLRIRDGQDDTTARYVPVVSFAPMDDAAEATLADDFADRLLALRDQARRAGKTIAVFHWSNVETTKAAKFPRAAAALAGITVDLHAWMRQQFFARTSLSIKAVAPLFGFTWEFDDADGLMSLLRIEQARAGGPDAAAARDWCLRYNEDDVAAQAAIRDGLRRLGDERAARGDRTRQ